MKPARRLPGTTRKLLALSLSIALAMSGVGIILPGMAQLSAAAGIGFVIGPAIGGLLGGIEPSAIGLPIANYSLPFLAAAGCALLALLTLRWLEEPAIPAAAQRPGRRAWTDLARRIGLPLAVAMAGQVAIALFETTFALHARTDLGMGLVEIGVVFMVCGLMMLVVQLGAVSRLARRFGEVHLASAALALMGLSLALLALAHEPPGGREAKGKLAFRRQEAR